MSVNVLSSTADTPLAALRRGDSFWRYQGLSGVVSGGIFAALGPIRPAALQVGPNSWIDSYRVWSLPPGNPGAAIYQDFSCRAPQMFPISFYPLPATPTGGTVVDPQLYVYMGVSANDVTTTNFGGVAANLPVAPRLLPALGSTYIDLIVYFQTPSSFPTTRAPLNNAFYAGPPGAIGGLAAGTLTAYAKRTWTSGGPVGAVSTDIFRIPTFGRQRVNWSLNTVDAYDWELHGLNLNQFGVTDVIDRTIATGTTVANTTLEYVLNGCRFDYVYLATGPSNPGVGQVNFTFEAED